MVKNSVARNIRILSGRSTAFNNCGFYAWDPSVARAEYVMIILSGKEIRCGDVRPKPNENDVPGGKHVSCPLDKRTTDQTPLQTYYISGM
jgi:hypothetical protein